MAVGIFSLPKGGLYGGSYDPSALDANTQSVMMDERWTTAFGGTTPATHITFSFPTSADDYTNVAGGYPDASLLSSFQELTDIQKDAVRMAFALVASYTNLTFEEVQSGLAADATFRFAQYSEDGSESRFPPNDGTYAPSDSRSAGDTYFGSNGKPPTAVFFGTDHFNTIMHEMGHAFGLKHGHDSSFNGALSADRNDNEFSVMTYASYLGSDTSGASEAWVGSAPQSYMMYDIAALQAYYGANFSKVGTTAVYTWDATTGQQYINGVEAPNTGVTETHKIFSTVWTQGATATYDLSNFNEDQLADLRPGQWLKFSSGQIADLNSAAPEGTAQFQAQGNIYNALLYNGDTRSLVSNLITGSGNDTLIGNAADNHLSAGAGNDTIYGGDGNDIISGGAGADIVEFGAGINVLRDVLADLNGDVVMDLGYDNSVDILGLLSTRAGFSVGAVNGGSTVGIEGYSFQLRGDFSGGDFMAVARGTGADAHTQLSFVNYLPTLSEGVRVDASYINGIANGALLTGDGLVGYSVTFKSAVSAYSNQLGYYKVATDGSISDVHMLVENTHSDAAQGQTLTLDKPAAGESIGFFMVQDGFNFYGDLPDDLSFVQWGGGASWTLHSASRGDLTSAEIFHSLSDFNPNKSVQVLSGLEAGSNDLWVGFEDLLGTVGDNDFQDVVISIRQIDGIYV